MPTRIKRRSGSVESVDVTFSASQLPTGSRFHELAFGTPVVELRFSVLILSKLLPLLPLLVSVPQLKLAGG
jgi:hypothetical protein